LGKADAGMDAMAKVHDPYPDAGFILPGVRVMFGDVRERLRALSAASVQVCVTSPPYFGLRSYLPDGHPDKSAEIGAEQTPEAYVGHLVEVFREVRRVLADDGTLWLNLGDSYAKTTACIANAPSRKSTLTTNNGRGPKPGDKYAADRAGVGRAINCQAKSKDLLMIPARVALALQADGWYLRSKIIWAKPNPMPESVRDRPTTSYEEVFLFAKSGCYFYDADAVKEPMQGDGRNCGRCGGKQAGANGNSTYSGRAWQGSETTGFRNLRNVWTITPKPFKGSHFATFPPDLPEKCILAGSRPGDTVLDPFAGSGTTGMVARQLGREAALIDLNPANEPLIRERIAGVQPTLFPA
jgi:DNA modification methylase